MGAFETKAVVLMNRLMPRFGFSVEDAAAVAGNGGHESGGFKKLQEISPTVKGSRGGYGWFQWTGPRRRTFEAWCKVNGLSPSSDEANIGFIIEELEGSEKAAVVAVKRAVGLDAKVKAFELAYERAGVKHYPSRVAYARKALTAYQNQSDISISGASVNISGVSITGKAGGVILSDTVTDEKTVRIVQQMLINIGYTEVGAVDGKVGTLTKTAIRAFRAENGLPDADYIDDGLITALVKAPTRPIAEERRAASASDVREKVPEVKANWRTKIASWWAGGFAAAGATAKGASEKFETVKEYVDPVQGYLSDVPGWTWLLIIACGAVGMALIATKGEKAGVQAFQAGARR